MSFDRRDYDAQAESVRNFLTTFAYVNEKGSTEIKYVHLLSAVANRKQVAFVVDLNDVAKVDQDLAQCVTTNTKRYVGIFSSVIFKLLNDYRGLTTGDMIIDNLDVYIEHRLASERQKARRNPLGDNSSSYPQELMRRLYVALRHLLEEGIMTRLVKSLGTHFSEVYFKPLSMAKVMSPRDVRADFIGSLVTVRGVVVRCTEVKPLLDVATYTCDVCGAETFEMINAPVFTPRVECESAECKANRAGGRLQLQTRGSKFVKFQELRIQEQSDQVPVGHVPRLMTVQLKGEITRQCFPGDSVEITGIFLPLLKTGFGQIIAGLQSDTYLEAHIVTKMNKMNTNESSLSEQLTNDEVNLVAQEKFYDKLACSIAPEIFGLEDVKKSLLLLLVGGTEINPRGMKIRGNINICLMGDPGVAKSQLLAYVDRIAPRSQYTTGRGSSGVGLTAAVMRDTITGEWMLEGGALVLADEGVCCIDEFDKMMDGDRTAIHEVMEQQTISIAKAGILTTLNARVSILAAANPIYGRYNPSKSIEQNIQLPAALLSRFDLMILLRDVPNREHDIKLAEHVTEVHRTGREPKTDFVPMDMKLIRRYVELCKKKQPIVPEHLTEKLVQIYTDIRNESRNAKADTTFTSPRTLLAILRLATALARLRLADEVDCQDIDEAVRLMEMSKNTIHADEQKQPQKNQRPEDAVFAVVKDMLPSGRADDADEEYESRVISYDQAVDRVLAKGFSQADFNNFIEIYKENNIIMVNRSKTKITFL